jgi:hypothetical protein
VTPSFAVARNFQCKGTWADRLLVAEADGWRVPDEVELAKLTLNTPPEDGTACACLFSIPLHMRTRFWAMLDEEAAEDSGDFVHFSDDLAEFLTFKDLPPPKDAVCELILQNAVGQVTTDDAWALINFGEEPVLLAWPELRLRLSPGEGLRTVMGIAPDVVPPTDEDLNVLVAVRLAGAA